MQSFIGREKELLALHGLSSLQRACLVVIRGRRRIGKSRLVQEFAKDYKLLSFAGLAPIKGVKAQDQRNNFARQITTNFGVPPVQFADWSDAFAFLTERLDDKPTIILLDEISWMGAKDSTFVPKLKNWWDLALQYYPKVILVLCGSVSTWITANIIKSTAFFGRISLSLNLHELSLPESYQLLRNKGFSGSIYDVIKLLAVTGGVPWYLEQIRPNQTADDNIKSLCFDINGNLVDEFDKIFHDLFKTKGETYKKIIVLLADGMKTLKKIRTDMSYAKSGSLSKYMQDLIVSGFVTEHYTWSINTGKTSKNKIYRLSDCYLRFYIKYIGPNLLKIKQDAFRDIAISTLPGWDSIFGFQVESLLLKNRSLLHKNIGIHPTDILADNPYIQNSTIRHKGCQIDYLIQSHSHSLFVCEFKFSRGEIGSQVIEQMQEKIKRLSTPRGYGVCPVLVHMGDVAGGVYSRNYFYRVIDIMNLLEKGINI